VTRGGLALQLVGLALVRGDGREAPRWRCAWRALLVWAPVVLLLFGCVSVKLVVPHLFLLSAACWWAAVLYLAVGALLAVRRPQQSVHDRLAGVFVVPR
jgi:eukaryotic-like serine/threonine-protein kinase